MRHTALVALAVLLASCGDPAIDRSELTVPEPDTSQLEPSLAEWLLGVRDDVEAGLADPDTSRAELAARFGDYGQVLDAFDVREAAIAAYDQAGRLDPGDFRWPYLAARLKEFLGDYDGARTDLKRALDLDPEAAHAWVRLGDVERAAGNIEAALSSYRRALEIEPAAAAYYGRGQAQLTSQDYAAAVEAFELALDLQPEASAVYAPLAQTLRALGRDREADEALQRRGRQSVVLDDPTTKTLGEVRVLGAYQALLSMAADEDLTPDELLGFALAQLGDVAGSDEAMLRDLSALEREDRGETRRQRARLHYALGGLRVYLERDEQAAGNFLRALELAPEMLAAELKLGNLLARRGAYGQAVERYDRVLAGEPENVEALVKRGTALLNLRQPERAVRDLERALELDAADALARVRLAEALEVAGDLTGTERRLRGALEDPSLDARGRALVLRGLGDFLVRRQRFEEAADALTSALEEDRTLTSARLRLADLLAHLEHYDQALAEYDLVVADQPSNAIAHLHRAAVLLLTGEWSPAIEALEVALALNPDHRTIQHQLARVLAANPEARDPDRALRLITAIHEQQPSPASAVTMGMALAGLSRFEDAIAIESTVPASSLHARRLAAYRSSRPYVTADARELLVVE